MVVTLPLSAVSACTGADLILQEQVCFQMILRGKLRLLLLFQIQRRLIMSGR